MKTNIPWEDSSQDQEECRLPQSTNIRCLPCGIIACAPQDPASAGVCLLSATILVVGNLMTFS